MDKEGKDEIAKYKVYKEKEGEQTLEREALFWKCIRKTVEYIGCHAENISNIKIGDVESLIDY